MNAPISNKHLLDPRVQSAINLISEPASPCRNDDGSSWTRVLEDNDFFMEFTPTMQRQIAMLIANNPGTMYSEIYNHLIDTVESIIKEQD